MPGLDAVRRRGAAVADFFLPAAATLLRDEPVVLRPRGLAGRGLADRGLADRELADRGPARGPARAPAFDFAPLLRTIAPPALRTPTRNRLRSAGRQIARTVEHRSARVPKLPSSSSTRKHGGSVSARGTRWGAGLRRALAPA
jgi:hypothetical protein